MDSALQAVYKTESRIYVQWFMFAAGSLPLTELSPHVDIFKASKSTVGRRQQAEQ